MYTTAVSIFLLYTSECLTDFLLLLTPKTTLIAHKHSKSCSCLHISSKLFIKKLQPTQVCRDSIPESYYIHLFTV